MAVGVVGGTQTKTKVEEKQDDNLKNFELHLNAMQAFSRAV